jgi:hypothetical protein
MLGDEHLFLVLRKPSMSVNQFFQSAVDTAFNVVSGTRYLRVADEGK